MNTTTTTTTTRTYKGQRIEAWDGPLGSYPGGEPRYYVQTYHDTGSPWSPECCPKFWTLKAAKVWIDERSPRTS